jgi:hypothetical protein
MSAMQTTDRRIPPPSGRPDAPAWTRDRPLPEREDEDSTVCIVALAWLT